MNLRGIQLGLKWSQRSIEKGPKGTCKKFKERRRRDFSPVLARGKIEGFPISLR
jgi:hypothetical protein